MKWSKLKRTLAINALILGVVALVLLVFDTTLQLGQFQGLVFYLYLLYFCALQLVVNLIIGVVLWIKSKFEWAINYTVGGILVPGIGIILVLSSATVI